VGAVGVNRLGVDFGQRPVGEEGAQVGEAPLQVGAVGLAHLLAALLQKPLREGHKRCIAGLLGLPGYRAAERDAVDLARGWLDRQFTDLGCEPLRPTGKVLTADKVVVVAQAAGPSKFADDVWAHAFARAASAALGKPVVHVDVPALTIGF